MSRSRRAKRRAKRATIVAVLRYVRRLPKMMRRVDLFGAITNLVGGVPTMSRVMSDPDTYRLALFDPQGRVIHAPPHMAVPERVVTGPRTPAEDLALAVLRGDSPLAVVGLIDEATAALTAEQEGRAFVPRVELINVATRMIEVLGEQFGEEHYADWRALLAAAEGKPADPAPIVLPPREAVIQDNTQGDLDAMREVGRRAGRAAAERSQAALDAILNLPAGPTPETSP